MLTDEKAEYFVWDDLFAQDLTAAREEALSLKPKMREAGYGGGTPSANQTVL